MILLRTVGRLVSPPGPRGKLSVLIFHRVRAKYDPLAPRALVAEQFDRILGWVAGAFNVLSPDEAVSRLANGTLPARALAITFDDGYADNAEVALPILQRHGLTAGFFIATDFLDGGVMWNDAIGLALRHCPDDELDLTALGLGTHRLSNPQARREATVRILSEVKYRPPAERNELVAAIGDAARAEPQAGLMMRSDQVRALRAAGMVIGGHTCSHPILASLSRTEAEREIVDGKARLEEILGERIRLFAYPNGKTGTDYTAEHAELVRRAGFEAAFSTDWGVAGPDTDRFRLPRFTPWDNGRHAFMFRLLRNMVGREAATA